MKPSDHSYRTWIEIDQKALHKNAEGIRALLAGDVRLLGVVKSNAYGHGIEQVVLTLDPLVDWFGVDSFDEAIQVRELSSLPILILNPMRMGDSADIVLQGFHQMISTREQMRALRDAAAVQNKRAHVHIKIDTGMSRQGFLVAEAQEEILPSVLKHPLLDLSGVSTHFASADIPDDPMSGQQLRRFFDFLAVQSSGTLRHAANSSATILMPQAHFDMVRVGIALYGIWPSREVELAAKNLSLTPVLSLKSQIMQMKTIPSGSRVGYGGSSIAVRDTRVALLPLGYADGYDRRFSNNADVLILGKRAPIIGNVSMNLAMVDVTDILDVKVGDTVVLLGSDGKDEITANDLADRIGTIGYEVVTLLNATIPRLIV